MACIICRCKLVALFFLFRSQQQTSSRPDLETGRSGRPRYVIPRQQLQLLVDLRFTNKDIAEMIGVSESVIKRSLR